MGFRSHANYAKNPIARPSPFRTGLRRLGGELTQSMPRRVLDNITIVLVEPQGPLNVGSVARAMKNFGLSRLTLVGSMDLTQDECRMMASRSQEILENAAQVATLADALRDQAFVIGTTARSRHRQRCVAPRPAAQEMIEIAHHGRVALLFGREDHGLSKAELAACHRVISIPTHGERMSLNLSQAVLLIAHELFSVSPEPAATADADDGNLIVGEQWRRLYEDMVACCESTGYLHEGTREAIEQSFTRLLRLGPIQTRDARHLFGLVRRVEKVMRGETEPRLPGDSSSPGEEVDKS